MKKNSGEIVLAICVGLAVATAGITWITANHNAKLVTMARDGKVYAGVQGSFGPGVVSAVTENKGQTALALIAGLASGVGAQQLQKQNNKTSAPATPNVSNTGNGTVIINTGAGNTSYSTSTTAAE